LFKGINDYSIREMDKLEYTNLLNKITKASIQIFGEKLVGVYLHGFIAMGCFNPKKSD